MLRILLLPTHLLPAAPALTVRYLPGTHLLLPRPSIRTLLKTASSDPCAIAHRRRPVEEGAGVVGPPVALDTLEEPAEVVKTASLEGVSELCIGVLQVLVGGFVAAKQVLVVAEEEEHEETEDGC